MEDAWPQEETQDDWRHVVNERQQDIYVWKDITNEFFESVASELKLGELLSYEMFGLFEAMSAIEMMDKKMDIGMVDGKENIPLTFDSALRVRYLLFSHYFNQDFTTFVQF